jgi:hypothetical protein
MRTALIHGERDARITHRASVKQARARPAGSHRTRG